MHLWPILFVHLCPIQLFMPLYIMPLWFMHPHLDFHQEDSHQEDSVDQCMVDHNLEDIDHLLLNNGQELADNNVIQMLMKSNQIDDLVI